MITTNIIITLHDDIKKGEVLEIIINQLNGTQIKKRIKVRKNTSRKRICVVFNKWIKENNQQVKVV